MKLLRPMEVAERLSVSRGKIYQMIKKGAVPSVNIDGCLRIPEEALQKMILQQLGEGKASSIIEDIHVLSGGRAERRKG